VKTSNSPLLVAAFKSAGKPGKQKKDVKVSVGIAPAEKDAAPSPHERKVEAAHYAHRAVVENWVRGEASTKKVKMSKARLQKVVKGHI
jgi:hypothetical protein